MTSIETDTSAWSPYSPAQRRRIRKATRPPSSDPSEAQAELNIVPFLDIVVNLIMFLLATTVAVLSVTQLESTLPGSRHPHDQTQSIGLSVTLTEHGIVVASREGLFRPGCEELGVGHFLTVPASGAAQEGAPYDWTALGSCVATLRARFPGESQVVLSADPQVDYRHLISAMDALRFGPEDEGRFARVLLAAGVH